METENVILVRPREEVTSKKYEGSTTPRTAIISGWRKNYINIRIIFSIIKIARECYENPRDVLRGLKYLISLRKKFIGDFRIKK